MNIYFDSTTGLVSQDQSNLSCNSVTLLTVNISEAQYLKASILPVPGEISFYPQIRDCLDLNLVSPERYYKVENNKIEELDTSQIDFPKECKYC